MSFVSNNSGQIFSSPNTPNRRDPGNPPDRSQRMESSVNGLLQIGNIFNGNGYRLPPLHYPNTETEYNFLSTPKIPRWNDFALSPQLPPPSPILGVPNFPLDQVGLRRIPFGSPPSTVGSMMSSTVPLSSSSFPLNPQGRERSPASTSPVQSPPALPGIYHSGNFPGQLLSSSLLPENLKKEQVLPTLLPKPDIHVLPHSISMASPAPVLKPTTLLSSTDRGPDPDDAEAAEELLMLFGTGVNTSSHSSPPLNEIPETPIGVDNKRKRKTMLSAKSDISQPVANPITKSSRQPATRSRSEKWTQEEDAKLRALVEKSMSNSQGKSSITDRWTKIAKLIGNKTSTQCFQHWHRVLNPDINKDPWTPEEEEMLLSFVKTNTSKSIATKISWSALAMNLKGRTDTQCRYQYIKLERSRKVPWTSEEDRLLMDLYSKKQQQPVNWVTISQDLYVLLQRSNETRNKTPPRTSLDCKLRVEELTGTRSLSNTSSLESNKSMDATDSSCEMPTSSCPSSESSMVGSPLTRLQFSFKTKMTPSASEDEVESPDKEKDEENFVPQRKRFQKGSSDRGTCPLCHKRVDILSAPGIPCSGCGDQFHTSCLNIKRKPRGNWSCDECKNSTAPNEESDSIISEGANGSDVSSDEDADKLISLTQGRSP